ncbi:MAG: hydrogenobyrinic acid a,c-diamide synthase (glutamine-hydrolyzing) [Candidatus Methanoplasma sp.]|jgi:cobyrinic acid a,c-diamide synthase|nr:hydrogenobyrinic acid a,c-diamide synthase (glutamine-hydrolyzing) [Candidatus Methanoplasma sp.]
MRGVVIAGTGSGVGKTSVAASLMLRLSRGMRVQPFKVGPDFIDPIYHALACGRPSKNLDSFMMGADMIKRVAGYSAQGSDLCVVEGVRGLFEGSSGTGDEGSTAEIAKILGLPVVLVVNASSLTRSAAAIVNGFASFDEGVRIAGVILNNVSGDQHERKLREAMDRYSRARVLGCVRRDGSKALEQRYLGLKALGCSDGSALEPLRGLTDSIDASEIREIAGEADVPDAPEPPYPEARFDGVRAAVPRDDAYCFYYSDNIECMRASGMKVEEFSPVAGDSLPDADVCYLGGGYPELFADRISENGDFLEGLRAMHGDGKRVVGECGGLMTMCSEIACASGERRPMAGIFDAEAKMTGIRHGPSYVVAESASGGSARAHEYHYSDVFLRRGYRFEYRLSRGAGIAGGMDGALSGNCVGTYMHQHALASDGWIGRMAGPSPRR